MPVEPVLETTALQCLTPEERALVAAIRGDTTLMKGDLDWDVFTRLAIAHDVAPLVHRWCGGTPSVLPPAVLSIFGEWREQVRAEGTRGLHERDDALEILGQAGLPCLVLKGGALARSWYGDVSLRPFADVDLLLSPDGLDPARSALIQAGYRYLGAGAPEDDAPHDIPLQRPDHLCAVELHYRLTTLPRRPCPSFEELEGRAVSLQGLDARVRTLGPEDTLIYLCVHMFQHFVSGWRPPYPILRGMVIAPGWRLLQLCDMARHIETFPIDWAVFTARAEEMDMRRGCAAVLGLVALLTGVDIPAWQIDEGDALRLLPLPLALVPDPQEGLGGASEVLAHLARRELAGAIRSLLFPPGSRHLRDPRRVLARLRKLVRGSIKEGHLMSQARRDVASLQSESERKEACVRLTCDLLALLQPLDQPIFEDR